jgi:class 3 adenylate cyclase
MIIFKDADAETNAVHGVKAAFDIYELNRQLQPDMEANFGPINVNMGINSGTALVGMTRFKGVLETRMTYTATGPVTNLAARLAAHASGGDIVIGEETRKLIHGLWPVHDHGLASLKGIDGPVRIYSLLR